MCKKSGLLLVKLIETFLWYVSFKSGSYLGCAVFGVYF